MSTSKDLALPPIKRPPPRNPLVHGLDESMLKKITECCKEEGDDEMDFVPCFLEEASLIFDEAIKCNLVNDQEKFKASLADVVRNRINADVQVKVQDQTFDCHLAVLQLSTEYFKQFTPTNMIVLDVPEVTKIGFDQAYNWMTKEECVPDPNSIIELYVTARFLQMPALINQLWFCFENPQFFREGEAFNLYVKALAYETSTLQSLLVTRVNRFFLAAVTTVEFLSLPPEKVRDLLNSSSISVNSEVEVFMSAFRWIACDWKNRKQFIDMLMTVIRFNLMPAWYLLSLKSLQSPAELKELLDNPTMQAKLNEGLSYTVTQHFMHEDSPLQEPLNMAATEQRDWIIDEVAPHHHVYKCPNWKYLDFLAFNIYIERIISLGPQHFTTFKPATAANMQPCCLKVLVSNNLASEL